MATVKLTQTLREEYLRLFQTCRLRPEATEQVTAWTCRLADSRVVYSGIGKPLGIPWHVVGIAHYRECSLNFGRHLHNGDPLEARTVHEPKGRPIKGSPPFSFEESATDALRYDRTRAWTDWSLPGTLYKLESYNGFGYRLYHPHVLSPYLWGRSIHYTRGGYLRDGVWSETYVNRQLGSAVLLRRLAELGLVVFDVDGAPLDPGTPGSIWAKFKAVRYDPQHVVELARELQQALNKIPGIVLREDGRAGEHTSDAYKRATGRYLRGDPRIR